METFGIFELLDALAALTAHGEAPPSAPEGGDRGTPAPAPEKQQKDAGSADGEALARFLARHDAISRRVKK